MAMAFTLGKLRAVVVTGALLVVAGVAALVLVGRGSKLRFHFKLPARLGADIKQEMHVFSYSQSSKGKTVFTIHASTYVQQNDGLITLHDAGILLYGRSDGQADHIRGQEFVFDPKAGVLRAVGEVFLDLAVPAPTAPASGAAAPVAKAAANPDDRVVHVKTSGLIFNQGAQTATTGQRVDWTAEGMTGDAIGADYNAKTGQVILRSAVHVSGLRNDRPVTLTAAYADLEHTANLLLLEQAKYVSVGGPGSESIAGDHATVHLSPAGAAGGAGTPQAIEANGHVVLSGTGRGQMTGDRLEVALNEAGKPHAAHLFGGVHYANEEDVGPAGRRTQGSTADLRMAFDAAGNPVHASLTGGVAADERFAGSGRALTADRVELALATASRGRTTLQNADAIGHAVLRGADQGPAGRTATEVRGDDLKARFAQQPHAATQGKSANELRVETLDGQGHTFLERTGADGSVETSRGDTLAIVFKPQSDPVAGPVIRPATVSSSAGAPGAFSAADSIQRAVQTGSVALERRLPARAAKAGAATASANVQHGPTLQRGTAASVLYDGDADRMTLTGGVRLADETDLLVADRVALDHATGDAAADGQVRVTYVGSAGGEPLHVVAARGVEHKSAGTADFFAEPGGNARMWQGLSQVEAPVLRLDRTAKTLVAEGADGGAGDQPVVRTVLAQVSGGASGTAAAGAAPSMAKVAPVRQTSANWPNGGVKARSMGGNSGQVTILSHRMTYNDGSREVVFDGRVRAEDRAGILFSRIATAFLAPPPPAAAAGGTAVATAPAPAVLAIAGFPAGRVERVVATGEVAVEQPGRRATGEKLIYTAVDQTFIMTGTRTVPPKMVDDAQGTVTGASLRFRSGEESVQVLGGADGLGDGRVRSETRVKK